MKSWVHNTPFPFFSNNIHVCITISWVTAEAFPKNILRCMKEKGVQGLTRDQVASHRQVIAISFLTDLFPSQVCYLVKQSYAFLGEAYMRSTTYNFISKKIQKHNDKLRWINDAPLNTTPSNHLYFSTQQQRAIAAGSISLGLNTFRIVISSWKMFLLLEIIVQYGMRSFQAKKNGEVKESKVKLAGNKTNL